MQWRLSDNGLFRCIIVALVLVVPAASLGKAAETVPRETLDMDSVVVPYSGIGEAYARAIGHTVGAARSIAVKRYGFDMPETISVNVTVDRSNAAPTPPTEAAGQASSTSAST